jgi:hypothetical protein
MVIWCLFDGSGFMGQPWALNGHKVYCFNADDADHGPYSGFQVKHENIHFVNCWIDSDFNPDVEPPDIVFAFPPCTDLAVSGSRHFSSKREKDPLFQEKAAACARVAQQVAFKHRVPYMIENPISVLSSLWRKPNHIFHPWEYGGYLPEDDKHPIFPDLIAPRDHYPKTTCLWTGGGFVMPEKRPLSKPEGYSPQYSKLGGKSAKTKAIRSLTPRGFAAAVFEFNSGEYRSRESRHS